MSGFPYVRVDLFLARRFTVVRQDEFDEEQQYRNSADPLLLEEFIVETSNLFDGVAEVNPQAAPSITGWWLGDEEDSVDIEEALHFFAFVSARRFRSVERHFRGWAQRLPYAFCLYHDVTTL